MSRIRYEIRRRFPRLTMSLVIAIIFFIISDVIQRTRDLTPLSSVIVPGFGWDVVFMLWLITIVSTAIFLVRALSDALVLGDIVTDIIVRRIGIKEERSPKRAARDLIYIIIIILIAMALLPILATLEEEIGSWLTMFTIYVALGIIVILIYDIGRILYKIVEQRAELFADRLSGLVENEHETGK